MARHARLLSADAVAILFMALCWVGAIALVGPLGEFPSVDDWAYIASVRELVEHGRIQFSDWTATNLLSQVFWGALFAVPFGVSYTTLRISTLVAGFLAALALYLVVRGANRPISLALLSALCLLFNPIFFALAFSFMTDVPFVAAQTGAMLFLLAGLHSGSRRSSIAGWALALVAQLSRQTGLAIPLAFAGAFVTKRGVGARQLAIAVLPIVVFVAVQLTYQTWLVETGREPLLFGRQMWSIWPTISGGGSLLASSVVEVGRYVFFYFGLFLLPLSLCITAFGLSTLTPKRLLVVSGFLAVAISVLAVAALRTGDLMPVWPHTWRGTGIAADGYGVQAPLWFLQIVTALSVAGGVLLLICSIHAAYKFFRKQFTAEEAYQFTFAVLGAAALIGILSLINQKFDRYLLPIIPWFVLWVVLSAPRTGFKAPAWTMWLGGAFLAGMAWYSIVNQHNYMVEKRTWAAAIDDLLAQGIPRETIDATWIFNGELSFGRYGSPTGSLSDWYRSRDYVVGIWPEPKYTLLKRYPVARWPIWGSTGGDVLVYGPNKSDADTK